VRVGILGAGRVGLVLAHLARAAGREVVVANSGDPQDIDYVVANAAPGARAVWATEACESDIVILAVPILKVPSLPVEALSERLVVDATNYWWETDGHHAELADPTTSTSETVAKWLPGANIVKALNHASVWELENLSRPAGHPERRGIAIAGDYEEDVDPVARFISEIGFSPVRAGALAEGVRFEPGTEAFGADATPDVLRRMLHRFWTSQRGLVVARARGIEAAPPTSSSGVARVRQNG